MVGNSMPHGQLCICIYPKFSDTVLYLYIYVLVCRGVNGFAFLFVRSFVLTYVRLIFHGGQRFLDIMSRHIDGYIECFVNCFMYM